MGINGTKFLNSSVDMPSDGLSNEAQDISSMPKSTIDKTVLSAQASREIQDGLVADQINSDASIFQTVHQIKEHESIFKWLIFSRQFKFTLIVTTIASGLCARAYVRRKIENAKYRCNEIRNKINNSEHKNNSDDVVTTTTTEVGDKCQYCDEPFYSYTSDEDIMIPIGCAIGAITCTMVAVFMKWRSFSKLR